MLTKLLELLNNILQIFFSPTAKAQKKEEQKAKWLKELEVLNGDAAKAYTLKNEEEYRRVLIAREILLNKISRLTCIILTCIILTGCATTTQNIPYSTEGKPWIVPKGSKIIRETIEPKEATVDYEGICLPEGEHQRLQKIEENYVLDQLTK